MKVAALAAQWRADAETLERYGDVRTAKVCRDHAEQVLAAISAEADDVLNLYEASIESGYSVDRLRHMVSDGVVPNAGKKGAPRIRRGDLPRKAREKATGFDVAAAARDVLASGRAP